MNNLQSTEHLADGNDAELLAPQGQPHLEDLELNDEPTIIEDEDLSIIEEEEEDYL
jgi:hypothetical protein